MRRTSALSRLVPRSESKVKGKKASDTAVVSRYDETSLPACAEADLHKGLLNDDLNSSFIYGTEFKIH